MKRCRFAILTALAVTGSAVFAGCAGSAFYVSAVAVNASTNFSVDGDFGLGLTVSISPNPYACGVSGSTQNITK